jgi:hypothetical protein
MDFTRDRRWRSKLGMPDGPEIAGPGMITIGQAMARARETEQGSV